MDDNLNNKLVESIDVVKSWVESGAELIAQEAPALAQEVVNWQMGYSILTASVLLFIASTLYFYSRKSWIEADKEAAKPDKNTEDVGCWMTCWAVCGIASTIFLLISMYWWSVALKCYVAPRLVVIEYLSTLLPK